MTGGIIPKRPPYPVDYAKGYDVDPTISEEPRIFLPAKQKNTSDILGAVDIESDGAGSHSGTYEVETVGQKCLLKAIDIHAVYWGASCDFVQIKFYIKRGSASQIALYRYLTTNTPTCGDTIIVPETYLEEGDILYLDWYFQNSTGAINARFGMQAHVLIV